MRVSLGSTSGAIRRQLAPQGHSAAWLGGSQQKCSADNEEFVSELQTPATQYGLTKAGSTELSPVFLRRQAEDCQDGRHAADFSSSHSILPSTALSGCIWQGGWVPYGVGKDWS